MSNSDVGTKSGSVTAERISLHLDLAIVKSSSSSLVEDLHKSRRKLDGYKESRRVSESTRARAEVELSKANKLVNDLTLLIERSNRGAEFHKQDIEALKMYAKAEEHGGYVEVMRDLEAVKEELSRLKLDFDSILGERTAAEKEVEELRFKTERDLRLLESLEKEIEVANEEHLLMECKKIERQREGKGKEVLDLLVEKNKRIKKMSEDAERSKDIERELFETTSDVEMLQTQLNLVKKMERRVHRRDDSMSRSNRSFGRGKYGLSVLKEVTESTEAKKEELASVNAELFRLMTIMDASRKEILQAKEEKARLKKILRKDDVKIKKLNSKMLMAKSKLEVVLSAKERVSALADNLVCSLEKLKKNREAAKKEERLFKEEKTVTKAETHITKLEIDKKERELISKLDELEKAKHAESFLLEKLS